MKVNEWAGLGNHTTAEFWEYSTQTGRRYNQDPKPNPTLSNYATFDNNPTTKNDPNGDCTDCPIKGDVPGGDYSQPDKSQPAELEDHYVVAKRNSNKPDPDNGDYNVVQAATKYW